MKIKVGKPSSVQPEFLRELEQLAGERSHLDLCPTCNGEGNVNVPDMDEGDVEMAMMYWHRVLRAALARKPEGVELCLMNNTLVVVRDFADVDTPISPTDLRLVLGAPIKFITNTVNYGFDDMDEASADPSELSPEEVQDIVRAAKEEDDDGS